MSCRFLYRMTIGAKKNATLEGPGIYLYYTFNICYYLFNVVYAFFTYICMVWCSFIFFQMKLIRSPNDQLLSIAPSRGCPTTFLKAWGWVTAQWILYFSNEQLRFNAFVHHLCAKVFFSARKEASQFEPGLWQSFLQRLVCRRPPPAEPTPRDSR